jgi:hypothetical protein
MPDSPQSADLFRQTMGQSAQLLEAWSNEELSDEVLADQVTDLVRTRDGARGFFATALVSNCPLMDRLQDPLVMGFQEVGDVAAMMVHHERNGDLESKAGSERVQLRVRELLQHLARGVNSASLVKARLEVLLEATDGRGEDVAFLDRWGYDAEQKAAIADAVLAVAEG